MKKFILYTAMAFMVCLGTAQASSIDDDEPSFWSSFFNAVLDAFIPTKLTPNNCDICHSNGTLYINYYEGSSNASYTASTIQCSDSGDVHYTEYYSNYYSNTPAASPFGTLTLTSNDSVYVDYDGFRTCLVLERLGETTKIKAVYSDGDKVYIDVKESFGTYDARDYVYLNTNMLSWDQGCFYVDLSHNGTIYRFSPAAVNIDNGLMYVSALDNNLYMDVFDNFQMGSVVPATMLPNATCIATANELVFSGDSLAIYQYGDYYYPYTVYAGGNCFFFD